MNNKKALAAVAGVSLAALAAVSCGGGGGGSGGGTGVTISGDFSAGVHAKWVDRLFNWVIPSAVALDPAVVSKVVVFDREGRYYTAAVENGAFSVSVESGVPVGLIFAGAGDNYLGYLALPDGIDSLPLNKLQSGVTAIDLQTLTSTGLVVEPSHNPIGNELPLTSTEQTATAQGDDFFAAVVKKADLDNDGKVDVLTGEHYYPQILYFIQAGSFGGDQAGDPVTPADIDSHKLALHAVGASRPATVEFTGPVGYPLSGSASTQKNVYDDSTTYFSANVAVPAVPPAGTYQVGYGTRTLTYDIPDQSGAPAAIVLPVPTVTLTAGGAVASVSWVYKLGDGTGTALDPAAIISAVELQIDGSGDPCAIYPQAGRVYNSGSLAVTTTSHTLSCATVQWAEVTGINMAYNDVYGNHYVAHWTK